MYIAIDLGATNTRVATFDALESDENNFETFETKKSSEEEISEISASIKKLNNNDSLEGIGIAIAMPLDENNETLNTVNLAKDFSVRKIIDELNQEFSVSVKIINDATAGGLMEGLEQDDGKFLYLTWGTGLGGNIVEKEGPEIEITECEAGHIPITGDGHLCGCGKKGCLEAYVGGAKIQEHYAKPAAELTENEWDEVLEFMAQGIGKLSDIYGFRKAIFNGTVVIKNPEFIGMMENKLKELGKNVSCEASSAGERSPVHGSLKLFNPSLKINFKKDYERTILR